jgi:hypothetical protein
LASKKDRKRDEQVIDFSIRVEGRRDRENE